jgi:hypothetical protein
MSQVGHADSKMTLDVHAQLEQRADRNLVRRPPSARKAAPGPVKSQDVV